MASLESIPQRLRIKGTLVEESVVYQADVPLILFALTDGENKIAMRYGQVLPDNFTHADELIVEGSFSPEQVFIVDKLMLQCPSKYEAGE